MIATLIACALTALPADKPLGCPIMGGPANLKGGYSDYNGVRTWYCCGGCDAQFEANPAKLSEAATKKGTVWGQFLFDPVSGMRLNADKAIAESSDFQGVRFRFESAENKAKFDADPKKYGTLPEKEALYCPAMKQKVASYGKASGYVDYDGVRYYMCCAGCEKTFLKDPAKLLEGAPEAAAAHKPGIATQKPDK